jgi:hypothetical protein
MSSRSSRRPSPVRLISYQTVLDAAVRPGAPPPGPGWPPPGRRRLHPVPPPPDGGGVRETDLDAVAFAIARAFAEVLAGLRPLHHVAGRATPEVYDRLAAALPAASMRPVMTAPGRRAARTLRVTAPRVQRPAAGVAEVCTVVFTGIRAQALALRLERFRGGWRCSAVETTISRRHLRDQAIA